MAYSLAVCDCSELVLKWMVGLFALALTSKILGTTGLFFSVFLLSFTWPKLYARTFSHLSLVVSSQ